MIGHNPPTDVMNMLRNRWWFRASCWFSSAGFTSWGSSWFTTMTSWITTCNPNTINSSVVDYCWIFGNTFTSGPHNYRRRSTTTKNQQRSTMTIVKNQFWIIKRWLIVCWSLTTAKMIYRCQISYRKLSHQEWRKKICRWSAKEYQLHTQKKINRIITSLYQSCIKIDQQKIANFKTSYQLAVFNNYHTKWSFLSPITGVDQQLISHITWFVNAASEKSQRTQWTFSSRLTLVVN